MSDCLFCNIIKKEIPSEVVFENEKVLGFKDIHPCSKIHILFIHKEHSSNVNDMVLKNINSIGDIYSAIAEFSQQEGIDKDGFRVVTNVGKNGRQAVFHTHFHFLAGEKLTTEFGV